MKTRPGQGVLPDPTLIGGSRDPRGDRCVIEADGDILTLAAVAQRLATGATIRVEADGATEGGVFVATQAKFEVD